MLIHDIIKMNYVREGYLPNHPYHLISDKEMFDAFLTIKGSLIDENMEGYFFDKYPCIDSRLKDEYNKLIYDILTHIDAFEKSTDNSYVIPDWVYSYMLGQCVGPKSDTLDRHDLLVLLNLDNIDDEITPDVCQACWSISSKWVSKLNYKREPTMFGEPHVIKSLRLLSADLVY